ncbi:MAG: hypothetical protein WBL40_01340 [Terrimicrobiaceae bacterium]
MAGRADGRRGGGEEGHEELDGVARCPCALAPPVWVELHRAAERLGGTPLQSDPIFD